MATQVPNRMLAFDGGNFAFRNKIINGDFRIDQRLALSVDNTNAAIKWVGDRWFAGFTAVNTFNTQCLLSDAPVGFRNSARVTLATKRTPAANDLYCFVQRIETQNLYNLNYGTASAKPITISFWVKSSIIGTYSARVLYSNDTTPALSYVYTYTINQANTWEFKIVTIPGNTTQGFYIAPNSIGFDVLWNLGTGSTRSTASTNQWLAGDFHTANSTISFVNQTAGATWQIAGVQLEEGSFATPFEQRPIGTELALCQRYYEKSYPVDVAPGAVNDYRGSTYELQAVYTTNLFSGALLKATFKQTKRTPAPTITVYNPNNGTANQLSIWSNGTTWNRNVAISTPTADHTRALIWPTAGTTVNSGYICIAHWTVDAEL